MKESGSVVINRKLLILTCLADRPAHGYAIIKEVEAETGCRIGPGTIYALLAELVADGYLKELPTSDRRTPLELTAEGREVLDNKLRQVERFLAFGQMKLAKS